MEMLKKLEYLIIHHTAVSRKDNGFQFEAVRKYHVGKGWGDIGYHYLIEPNGLLMKGRQETEAGAHCKEQEMNYRSLGICLTGNFDAEEPTKEQLKCLADILSHLRIKYDIPFDRVKFHRDYAAYKTCPGKLFTGDVLKGVMSMRELVRDASGGFWFVKTGDNSKQKIDVADKGVAGLLTVISREFGVRTVSDKSLDKLENKNHF